MALQRELKRLGTLFAHEVAPSLRRHQYHTPPGERRRYMDIALCQIDPVYTRTLSAYQKILVQRNSLLKNLRDQGARPGSAPAPRPPGPRRDSRRTWC